MAPLHFPKIALPSSISGTNMKNVNLNNDPLDLTNTSFLFLKINPIHEGGGEEPKEKEPSTGSARGVIKPKCSSN